MSDRRFVFSPVNSGLFRQLDTDELVIFNRLRCFTVQVHVFIPFSSACWVLARCSSVPPCCLEGATGGSPSSESGTFKRAEQLFGFNRERKKSIWCLQEPLTIRGEGEMIRHGTGTVNDCYPPVISLFRAAAPRAHKASRCLSFYCRAQGCWLASCQRVGAYKRLFTAERGESLIWSLGGSSTAVLSHGWLCSSLAFQCQAECCDNVQKGPFPAWCWSSTSTYLPSVLTWYDSYCRNVNATFTADGDRNNNQKGLRRHMLLTSDVCRRGPWGEGMKRCISTLLQ